MHTSDSPRKALPYSLHKLAFILQRLSDDVLQREFGIGFAQFRVMLGLKYHPGCEQRVLAGHMDQTEAGISRMVRQMQEDKLIAIKKDPKDARRRHVTLTASGEATLKKAKQLLERLHGEVTAELSETETAQLQTMLDRLRLSARKHCKKG